MNINEKYFISLIFSHLNNTSPYFNSEVDYNEIYRLSAINNISAIIYNELIKLSKDEQKKIKNLSDFKQQFGYTLIDFDEKISAVSEITSILNEANIDHIFVKGAIIRDYYPVKELRTSADTDIIVRQDSFDRLKEIIKSKDIKITTDEPVFLSIHLLNQNIEISTDNCYDHEYFKDIFSFCTQTNHQYILDDYNHLIYILCHIIKHFKYLGAGIKMFMDIDVLIRHIDDFDYDKVIELAKKLDIEMFTKSALSLCNYLFNTPVKSEIDFNKNENLRELFEKEIINAGAFGFSKRDLGSHYLISSAKNGKSSRFNAFLTLLFPKKIYLKNQFNYAKKHPVLLPIAWLHRLLYAIFKRGSHSLSTISSIATSKSDNDYARLLSELNIEN